MRAYKFRSPEAIHFGLDIILERRLFCADWRRLNDPLEGHYRYSRPMSDNFDYQPLLDGIRDNKGMWRVCSLSRGMNSYLLWAHYAAAFTGFAIEVDLPDNAPEIQRVKYERGFPSVAMRPSMNPGSTARSILCTKKDDWSYEEEVRILSRSPFFHLSNPIKSVVLGSRMEPALQKALTIICNSEDIPVYVTGLGDEGVDADAIE